MLQQVDRKPLDRSMCQVVTKRSPSEKEWEALIFARRVVKHVKSNAIVLAQQGQTVGM